MLVALIILTTIRNWDKEKNKLLELYGYSLNDELSGKFEFIYKEGKPFLKVLDPSIKKIMPVAASAAQMYLYTDSELPEIATIFSTETKQSSSSI